MLCRSHRTSNCAACKMPASSMFMAASLEWPPRTTSRWTSYPLLCVATTSSCHSPIMRSLPSGVLQALASRLRLVSDVNQHRAKNLLFIILLQNITKCLSSITTHLFSPLYSLTFKQMLLTTLRSLDLATQNKRAGTCLLRSSWLEFTNTLSPVPFSSFSISKINFTSFKQANFFGWLAFHSALLYRWIAVTWIISTGQGKFAANKLKPNLYLKHLLLCDP